VPLTDAEIRSFKSGEQRFRRSDGGGLFVDVMPSGKKVFRLAYRSGGAQRTVWLGDYPTTRLADARLKAAEIKLALRNGKDPKEKTSVKIDTVVLQAEPSGPLWREIANDYLLLRKRSGAAAKTLAKLSRHIEIAMDALGDRPIKDITAEELLGVVNPIAESGRVETAHGVRSRFSQIFRYAAARGLCTHDPASVIIDAMISRQGGEFAGITEPKAVRKLLQDIYEYRKQHAIVGSALLLSAYLFTRNTELRGMQWAEIDWDAALWEIPATRMKANRDHVVPLPSQVLSILTELKEIDFGSKFVFPSPRDPGRTLSNMAFNSALRRIGYTNDVHVHHGFRTTASTNLNEMGWNSDWIERQLAHVPANKVRASYNKAEYLDGRRKMMQAYADWLDGDPTARNNLG
jgi:integrase